jgi:hypothetical protein
MGKYVCGNGEQIVWSQPCVNHHTMGQISGGVAAVGIKIHAL